jgi:hypothetical protein
MIEKALLLVGSPRGERSNSHSLGSFLLRKMEENGVETRTMTVKKVLQSQESVDEMLEVLDASGLLVFAFPLYFDSLPAMDIRLFDRIAEHRSGSSDEKGFVAIVNCGYPEAHHASTALEICRQFAHEASLDWMGGLSLGGGEIIGGRPLEEVGGVARNIVKALNMSASELCQGRPVPQESVERMALPLAPKWLFVRIGNRGWKKRAKERGIEGDLNARPYQ